MVYIGKDDNLIYGNTYTIILVPYHNGDFSTRNIIVIGQIGENTSNAKFDDFIKKEEFRNKIIDEILDEKPYSKDNKDNI